MRKLLIPSIGSAGLLTESVIQHTRPHCLPSPCSLGTGSPKLRDAGDVVAVTSHVNNEDSRVMKCDGALPHRTPGRLARPALPAPASGPAVPLSCHPCATACSPRPADPAQHTNAIQGLGPHTAPLGARFYRAGPGTMFPPEYNNTLFIAIHGSLHRWAARALVQHRRLGAACCSCCTGPCLLAAKAEAWLPSPQPARGCHGAGIGCWGTAWTW
jgi:hypothetical protein